MASKIRSNDGDDADGKENIPPNTLNFIRYPSDFVVDVPKELHNSPTKHSYSVEDMIGMGTFSKCYRVRLHEFGGEPVDMKFACKVLAKAAYSRYPYLRSAHQNEIDIHSSLDHHDNVVGLFEHFNDARHIYIMLSYCCGGSLCDAMDLRESQGFTKLETQNFLHQILDGVQFIHGKRIIHGDLKLENVFIDARRFVRIGDLGLAVRYVGHRANENNEMHAPNQGTVAYLAPESIVRGVVSFKTDIWAIAVIAYTMRLGLLPFRGLNDNHTRKLISSIDYYHPISLESDYVNLLEAVFVKNPIMRPTAEQCLEMPYFNATE